MFRYCDSNIGLFSIAKATTIAIAILGRAITLEREPSKKKQRTDTKKDAKRIKITLQEAIEKSPILLSQYWKNEWTMIFQGQWYLTVLVTWLIIFQMEKVEGVPKKGFDEERYLKYA